MGRVRWSDARARRERLVDYLSYSRISALFAQPQSSESPKSRLDVASRSVTVIRDSSASKGDKVGEYAREGTRVGDDGDDGDDGGDGDARSKSCLLYTSPSPRDS